MDDFLFQAMAIRLFYAGVGLILAVLFLRWLDWTLGVRFGAMLRAVIGTHPVAAALYYAGRFLAVCLLIGLLVGCAAAQAGPPFADRYDPTIRRAVERYWPDYPDWLAWKAQLYQESRLDPRAVSPAGAAGLAQFMPGTWREVARELRLPPGASPHQDIAIEAGAYYMAKLRRAWSAPRPQGERHTLAQASYNAGLGSILRAQSLCAGGRDWPAIAPCLPRVTGERNARETATYVARIAHWRRLLAAAGEG
ncbi:hypothetical protein GCM10010964_18470 [Caldovatus sediminis]|uniref:Transglycosylase SLT domain-containing protein n=1 Tax=Caldovatus sediminis TaxID=2041189 RepID=A0A8J3EC23_9PROT|nr:transglycosylase SLT domain-containing protein [Caldovatus sediminis]GGG30859.1 hypothetical protein GCM10010964_18470 [Caldovatus sediminis]